MRTTEFIVSLVGTDVLGGPTQSQMYFLNEQGLGGSRCGSVTVRFKHHTVVFFIAAPPLRYLPVSDSKSKRNACADCLSV